MRLLLDTHLLIWSAQGASPLSKRREQALAAMVQDASTELFFSAASIWEVAIKRARRRGDFTVEPLSLRRLLLRAGFVELAVTSLHGAAVAGLPLLHGDPFDRLLVAQAAAETCAFVTVDDQIARYPGDIRKI